MPYYDPAHHFGLRTDTAHRDPWVVFDSAWDGYVGDAFTCVDATGITPVNVSCTHPLPPTIIHTLALADARNQFGTPLIPLSSLAPPPDFISVRVIGELHGLQGYADACLITDGVPAGCDNQPPLVNSLTADALGSPGAVGHYVADTGAGGALNLAGNLWRNDATPVYTADPDNTASNLLFTLDEITTLRILLDSKLGQIGDSTEFQFRVTPWWLTTPPPAGQFMCVL